MQCLESLKETIDFEVYGSEQLISTENVVDALMREQIRWEPHDP